MNKRGLDAAYHIFNNFLPVLNFMEVLARAEAGGRRREGEPMIRCAAVHDARRDCSAPDTDEKGRVTLLMACIPDEAKR